MAETFLFRFLVLPSAFLSWARHSQFPVLFLACCFLPVSLSLHLELLTASVALIFSSYGELIEQEAGDEKACMPFSKEGLQVSAEHWRQD